MDLGVPNVVRAEKVSVRDEAAAFAARALFASAWRVANVAAVVEGGRGAPVDVAADE